VVMNCQADCMSSHSRKTVMLAFTSVRTLYLKYTTSLVALSWIHVWPVLCDRSRTRTLFCIIKLVFYCTFHNVEECVTQGTTYRTGSVCAVVVTVAVGHLFMHHLTVRL